MRRNYNTSKYLLAGLIFAGLQTFSVARESESLRATSVAPDSGVTTPGTKVVIRGTGFSPNTIVYFDGLQVREANYVSPSSIEVVTPYLRQGRYQLQFRSDKTTVQSTVTYLALPSPVDSEIDRAIDTAGKKQPAAAIAILSNIAKTNDDYQVRAFAHYQAAQVYFAQGDWWRWAGEAGGIFLDSDKAGAAVDTSWRYRLALDQSDYFLPTNNEPDHDEKLADWTVEKDVTENPEPRFFRGLVNARYGNLRKAKADSDFILKLEPNNPFYRALAAYVTVLAGDQTTLESFSAETISDARALSLLGETAYLRGDFSGAQLWWAREAKAYPLGASLAYWAGKKHLTRGHQRVAVALLTECATMAPNSKEAKEAKELLASVHASDQSGHSSSLQILVATR